MKNEEEERKKKPLPGMLMFHHATKKVVMIICHLKQHLMLVMESPSEDPWPTQTGIREIPTSSLKFWTDMNWSWINENGI